MSFVLDRRPPPKDQVSVLIDLLFTQIRKEKEEFIFSGSEIEKKFLVPYYLDNSVLREMFLETCLYIEERK